MQIVVYSESRLVKRNRGTVPILLTCPHDGSEAPAKVRERTASDTPARCQFKTGRDSGAAAITEGIAQKILEITGLSPYVVIAKFHRKFIDANRNQDCAFIDPDALKFYDEYHKWINFYIRNLTEQNNGLGFLFDVHGVGEIDGDPADVYFGTANGDTFLPSFDRDAFFMNHGLHGYLKWTNQTIGGDNEIFSWRVSPADSSTPETSEVNGGFTVRHYSSKINCVQIELNSEMRLNTEKRRIAIEDLAFGMINFVRRHAPF